jgi:hypothetical protein
MNDKLALLNKIWDKMAWEFFDRHPDEALKVFIELVKKEKDVDANR